MEVDFHIIREKLQDLLEQCHKVQLELHEKRGYG